MPDVTTAPFTVHVCVCTHMHVCISVCDAAASGWAELLSVSSRHWSVLVLAGAPEAAYLHLLSCPRRWLADL